MTTILDTPEQVPTFMARRRQVEFVDDGQHVLFAPYAVHVDVFNEAVSRGLVRGVVMRCPGYPENVYEPTPTRRK